MVTFPIAAARAGSVTAAAAAACKSFSATAMSRCEEVIALKVEEEYVLTTQRRRELLRMCGVAEEDLSKVRLLSCLALAEPLGRLSSLCLQDGQLFLHVLSETAEILQLSEPTSSSYLMAMTELEDSLDDAERQARTARKAVGASQKRSQELLAELKDLENTQQHLDDAVEERERHAENETLRAQLRQFHNLPLNADVAAAKLYEAQAELRRLEDSFSSQIKEML
ncbi:hypothetical protein BBJ28_00019357 [Nothophytophthora sp. Chile5]|nr:hypothetical protein BBJ28_00019357 [Nothophytophthora sp. Chile5]